MKKFKDLKVGGYIYGACGQNVYKYEITEKGDVYFRVKLPIWSFDMPLVVDMDEYQDGSMFSCVEALFNFIKQD